MHDKCRAAGSLTVVDEAASQLFNTCALQQQVQRAAVVGYCSRGSWLQRVDCATNEHQSAKSHFDSARSWRQCSQNLMTPSAPSGTYRVAVDLLHQLRQAIVFSFSSQFQEVFPVSAICGVGQSAILHHSCAWTGGQSRHWWGAGSTRQDERVSSVLTC